MVNNKYIGIYKTESEYDFRECLVLAYCIPLNKEMTKFDYDNSLIVDLRTVSQSIADYLRDLTQSADALSFKSFMEFASTRKFQSRDIDILTFLHNNEYIRKVPASCVKIRFSSPERGEYALTLEEINAMIRQQIGETEPTAVVASNHSDKWDGSDFTNATKELVEVKEQEPFIERVVREDRVEGNVTKQPPAEQATSGVDTKALQEEIVELRAQLAQLTDAVLELKNRPKAGRPKKAAE